MDEGLFGILLLAVVSVVASIVFHARGRGFFRASFTAAITAIVTLLVVDTIRRSGYPDPKFPIAFVVGRILAFLISLAVGFATRWVIQRRRKSLEK